MVFCGKPSKACQRCRDRKLKCDLRKESCSACIRAQVVCTGYRDTSQLRIRNESLAVQRKQKKAAAARAKISTPVKVSPSTLLLPIELEAREAFFISRIGYGWEFLHPFYDSSRTPEHVTLSIEAVSLAYLSHQVYSEIALNNARERYVSALRLTNNALQSPKMAAEETTLVASLLLDLFEKITNDGPIHDQSWIGHVNGALALVRLRGLENFTDRNSLQLLVRLSTNLIISCVASDTAVPEEIYAIRAHAERFLDDVDDPKWRGTGLTMDFTALRADIRSGLYSIEELLRRSVELDQKIETLTSGIPEPWSFRRIYLDSHSETTKSERILSNYFDIYADRHITQSWNVMRLSRIMINEWILEQFHSTEDQNTHPLAIAARQVIIETAQDICAAAPQYTDCFGIAAASILPSPEDHRGTPFVSLPPSPTSTSSLSSSSTPFSNDSSSSSFPSSSPAPSPSTASPSSSFHLHNCTYNHTPSRHRSVYTLIFPLYVAAWSRGTPLSLKLWIVQQLHYMADHFGVKNAGLAARLLEDGGVLEDGGREKGKEGEEGEKEDKRTKPWAVYAMLGSYAFAAC